MIFCLFAFLLFTAKNKTNSFVRFLGESTVPKSAYGFIWPLISIFASNVGRMEHFKNQRLVSHHSCLLVSFWMVRDMTALTWPQLIGMMGFAVSVHDQVSDLQFQKAVLCHLTDILAISKISKKLFVFPLRLGDKTVKRLRFQFTVPWN